MDEYQLIIWANHNQSPFVRGFAWRLLGKKCFRKGNWKDAIKFAKKAMTEYPPNSYLFQYAEHDYIKYQLSALISDELFFINSDILEKNEGLEEILATIDE